MTTDTENAMPLLTIEARGEIISSNFEPFAAAVRKRLSEFNLELTTDDDFDQAGEDAKLIKGAEDSLKAAKEKALAQAEDLNDLFSKIDDLTGELAAARLNLTRQIEKRKLERKTEIVNEALRRLDCDQSMRGGYRSRIEAATKSRRSFAAMEAAVLEQVEFANFDIARCRNMLDEFEAKNGRQLTLDRRNLECSNPDVLVAELTRRIEAAQAESRERKLREEAYKARQEAAAAQTPAPAVQTPPAAAQEAKTVDDPPWDGPSKGDDWTLVEIKEWNAFRSVFLSAFNPVKDARTKLQFTANIDRAARLSEAVNQAWKEANQ